MTRSKIQVTGVEARHYDFLMNLITFGAYPRFIRRATAAVPAPGPGVLLDIGCGTGRNARLLARHLTGNDLVLGLDIGTDMLKRFAANMQRDRRLAGLRGDIRKGLPLRDHSASGAFLSFVLHGLEHHERLSLLTDIRRVLKPGAWLSILDYRPFDLARSGLLTRLAFRLECELAAEFLSHDWERILSHLGFHDFTETRFFSGKVRILNARSMVYTEHS